MEPHSKSSFYVNNLDPLDVYSNVSSVVGNKDSSLSSTFSSSSGLSAFESVVQTHLTTREDEYTDLQNYRIFVGTWNVNGQNSPASLCEWLANDPSPPDVYAIGFQELDLSKEAFLFTDSPKEEEWLQACVRSLHPKATYVGVKLVRLIGMMLIVFVRKELKDLISGVAAETVGTGLLGRMGNKGGVAIRFDFCNTSLCFVNCHLAAHVEEFERRNQDYNEINNRLAFSQFRPIPKLIQDHDQVYWFGDLNYRITDIDTDSVKEMLSKKAFESLKSHDQLRIQHDNKKVFVGYTEGSIRFMPTYKYDPGTDDWDSSEKNRPPAWCDRILYRGGPTHLLTYRSHPGLKVSDHKPVSALFDSSIKVINEAKYKIVYQDVMKKLDRLENECLPQVAVDKTDVNFDIVSFRESVVRYLTVANTGQVVVLFSFLKKPNQTTFCKDWLRANPSSGKIRPGATLDIELEVFVDGKNANNFNTGLEKIEDILVLHLEHGRDLFISVSGSYRPSVFGSSIECLVRLKCPIREVEASQLMKIQAMNDKIDDSAQEATNVPVMDLLCLDDDKPVASNSPSSYPVWDIPKEVWMLVDYLYKNGLDQEDLFLKSGLHSEFLVIRETLDSGWPQEFTSSIHSIAESLLTLLDSFLEPVIPFNLYQKALDGSNNFSSCQEVRNIQSRRLLLILLSSLNLKVISLLPIHHKHVFLYIIAFVREVLRHSRSNKSDPKALGESTTSYTLATL
jgi:phosphatidylinositol-bisphosphatase